jgi:hypothetical protein
LYRRFQAAPMQRYDLLNKQVVRKLGVWSLLQESNLDPHRDGYRAVL